MRGPRSGAPVPHAAGPSLAQHRSGVGGREIGGLVRSGGAAPTVLRTAIGSRALRTARAVSLRAVRTAPCSAMRSDDRMSNARYQRE
jgi:hypothetical protein